MNLRRCFCYGVFMSIMVIGCLSAPQYHDNRGSTFVDASVYLLYLPSLMSTVGLENLGKATQGFLRSKFDNFVASPDDIRVIVSSQALDGRKAFNDNSTFFVVQANLQILVQSQGSEALNPLFVEDKILTHFTEDWTELSAMLKLLDPNFFGNLKYIELKANTIDDFPGIANSQETEDPGGLPNNALILYMVLGIGIVVASLMLLIPFCIKRLRSKRGSARETIISSFSSEGSGGAERLNKEKVSKSNKEKVVPKKKQRPKLPTAPCNEHNCPREPVRKAPSEIFVSDDGCSTGQIQRIFSKDKVCLMESSHHSSSTQHSLSIRDLKAHKKNAEDSFRESLRGIIRQPVSEVDLESGQREKYIYNVHRVLTPQAEHDSSDHDCPRYQRKDTDAQKRSRRNKKQHELMKDTTQRSRASATERKLSISDNQAGVFVEDVGENPARSGGKNSHKNRSSPPVVSSPSEAHLKYVRIISHTNDHDGCSVSTITGSSSISSAESIQYQASSEDVHSKKSKTSQQIEDEDDTSTTMSYCIGSDADDFGSIAHSLPSYARRDDMEYLEEV